MGIEVLTRAAKRFYEELYFQQTERQLFARLFGVLDESTEAAFLLDKLIGAPYAVTYRDKNGESHVRKYSPGSGNLIEPPIASEKTPLTEELLDKIVAGVEANGGFGTNEANLVNGIIRQHVSAMNMLKNWQAMQVFVAGQFYAKGPGGSNIGLDIDFSRAVGNALTADFSAVTISEALAAAVNKLRDNGTNLGDIVAILGTDWQNEFGINTDVKSYMQNNNAATLVEANMMPQELLDTDGLYVIARFRGPGMISSVWLCGYAPPVQFVKDEGETAEAYIDSTKAVFFSLSDIRYRVNRGVNIVDDSGKRMRAVGDLVIDRFSENDPVTEYLRSSTRHVLVPGNINHSVVTTGSNFN